MEFLVLLLLILLNGFFSLMEVAFITSEKEKIEGININNTKNISKILNYMNEPERYLSSIQVGITLIGIVSGVFSGITLTDDFAVLIDNIEIIRGYAREVALVIVVGSVTYLSIVIGELVPKTIGMKNPEKILVSFFPIINIFNIIFHPFVIILSLSTRVIIKIIKIEVKTEEEKDFLKEIVGFTAIAARKNRINKTQEQIINNAVEIQNKKISDIMVHKKDIKSLDARQSISEAMIEAHIHHHTRFPLVEDDNIIGYINFKDIMNALKLSRGKPNLKGISRPIYRVNKNENVGDVMQKLIKNHQHIAIVEENEIVIGMITLENVLEAVVGNIEDEYDVAPNVFYSISDDVWIVGGGVPIDRVREEFKDIPEHEGVFGEWIKSITTEEMKVENVIRFEEYKIIVRKISRGKLYEAIIEKNSVYENIKNKISKF